MFTERMAITWSHSIVHIARMTYDLRIPATGEVIAKNVTPKDCLYPLPGYQIVLSSDGPFDQFLEGVAC